MLIESRYPTSCSMGIVMFESPDLDQSKFQGQDLTHFDIGYIGYAER